MCREEEGPCKEVDVEATSLLCEFTNLCQDVKRDIDTGRIEVSKTYVSSDDADKITNKMTNMFNRSWSGSA